MVMVVGLKSYLDRYFSGNCNHYCNIRYCDPGLIIKMTRCDPCPNPNEICSCILHPAYQRFERPGIDHVEAIILQVADQYKMPLWIFKSKSRQQEHVRVRDIAIRRAVRETNCTLDEIGDVFNRGQQSIVYALNK